LAITVRVQQLEELFEVWPQLFDLLPLVHALRLHPSCGRDPINNIKQLKLIRLNEKKIKMKKEQPGCGLAIGFFFATEVGPFFEFVNGEGNENELRVRFIFRRVEGKMFFFSFLFFSGFN
jgi:hypothetical protein